MMTIDRGHPAALNQGRTARDRRFPVGLLAFLLALGAFGSAFSQQEGGASAEDEDLFGEEEVVAQSKDDDASIREAFLKSDAATITGTFTGTMGASAIWNDPWGDSAGLFSPDASTFDPVSELAIGFSAKPATDLGFYGEVRTAYPFVDAEGDADIKVFKLYSKFSWKDKLFFSFGKQPLKWGQGYFFAPANDILSLGAIDYYDPEAEREGPLSLKAHLPFLGSMMNAYLFLVAPAGADHVFDVAVAPKIELSLPSLELALSGYYQRDDKARAILSGSWSKSGVTAFGEGVLKFGSDRLFIEEDGGAYSIADYEDNVFFTGTAGVMYMETWEKKLSLTAVGQYLYDGEAQENLSWNDLRLAAFSGLLGPDPLSSLSRIGTRLGRHYAAFSVSASEILDTDLGASVFAIANLADFSGWIRPEVSYKIFDRLTASLWAQFNFGGPAGEYTDPAGVMEAMGMTEPALKPPAAVGFKLSLGTGSF